MTEYMGYEQDSGVATLTMDDGKANAFGPGMIAALSAGLDRAAKEAGAVIIAGRPGVLCAGFDLKIIRGDDDAARDAMRAAGAALLLKLYLHPQPVIFACPGHAVAAGALLLLTGDCRIGVRGDFKIGLNEVGIGLALPPFGLELARDRLDPRAVSQAVLGATLYEPTAAAEVGYLDRVVEPEALLEAAAQAAREVLRLDGPAFAETKRRFRSATIDRINTAGRP